MLVMPALSAVMIYVQTQQGLAAPAQPRVLLHNGPGLCPTRQARLVSNDTIRPLPGARRLQSCSWQCRG